MTSSKQGNKPDSQKIFSLPVYFEKGYILVADDMTNMRKTVKNMLRSMGVTNIMEASDGDLALKTLRQNPNCFFILMDWNMPRMPGIEAVREIRADEDLQDIPIVMITAETTMDQIAEAGEIGVNGYIIKPFVSKILGAKILSVLQSRTNPPEHVKLIKAGEALIKQGQFDLALEVFTESSKLHDTARIRVNIGEAYEKMGKNDMASGSYQTAAEKNPVFLKAHVASTNLHMKTGNKDAALKSLENAIKISPRNTERQISAGKIYLVNGNHKKAQAAFEVAVKLEPAKGEEIAEELLKEGKAELAETFFRNSLAADSGNAHIYNRLGIALRRQGKWFDAIEEYKKAIKIDPKDDVIYFNMGKAYIEGGNKDEAADSFKKALKINPALEEAKKELEKL